MSKNNKFEVRPLNGKTDRMPKSIQQNRKLLMLTGSFLFGLVWLVGSSIHSQEIPSTLAIGPAEPLPPRLYTFNADLLTAIAFQGVGYDSPQFEDAVRRLRPQGLRFPGGTQANNYLWKDDSFSEPLNDKTGWAGEQIRLFRKIGRPYDLPGFARISQRNKLSSIWVLNVYEESPESVIALFDQLDRMGLEVTEVEMANEPYWDGRSFNDVSSYIRFSRPLAETLKKHRPEVKIGACFAPLGNPANYEAIWNTPLASETWFDAIIYHDYYGGQGFVLDKGESVPVAAMLHPEALIETPVEAFGKLLPGKPIWYTEWNVGVEGLAQWKNTGAELQFIAAIFCSLIEHRESIDVACFHAIYDQRFGAVYMDEKTGIFETNASHELFRMLGEMFANAESLRPVSFATKDLRGFATQQGDDVRLFVLNRGTTSREVTWTEMGTGELTRLTIDCRPDRKLPRSTPLAASVPVEDGKLTLPPNSISLISSRQTLDFKPNSSDDDNLFPRRPDLMLWYPPYASEQPRFDQDGVYVVDLEKCKDKDIAVLKMNLNSLKLKPGREYQVDFDARMDGNGGLIVKLPIAATESGDQKQKDGFSALTDVYSPKRYTFKFDPASNEGEVSFVFTKEMIEKGSAIHFRNFRIRKLE